MNLKEVIDIRASLLEQEKKMYLTTVNQINSQMKDLLKKDIGSQFLKSCGRDFAGELIRNYFDTTDYYITADQMAERMLNFSYDNEYDPLANNGDLQKLVYNYNDTESSATMQNIMNDLEKSKSKLFEKETTVNSNGKVSRTYKDKTLIDNRKKEYREQRNSNVNMIDDYTENKEIKKVNSIGNEVSQLDVEHTQALSTAYVYNRHLKEGAENRIKEFYNSPDNFAMMGKTANQSKGDVKVYEKDSKGNYKLDRNGQKIDITHKATPEQMAEEIINRWENCSAKERLKEEGTLGEDYKVTSYVKKTLITNLKKSQNAESKVILKETDYKKVATDSGKYTMQSFGKIVGGQVIYYTIPPLLYEIKLILKDKKITLEKAMDKLNKVKDRLCKYVISKLGVIFKGIINNGLKKFIKSFFDVLINMVKDMVKKMLKLAKNIVLATVDAIKILGDKNSAPAQKADSIFNLFSITITAFAVEIIFEYLQKQFGMPEPLLMPLQTILTVVCTNLVMLVLQELDLFDVRYGLLISNIESIFDRENQLYMENLRSLKQKTQKEINIVINSAKSEIEEIKQHLHKLDIYSDSTQKELDKLNKVFNMKIDFEKEWKQYIEVVI